MVWYKYSDVTSKVLEEKSALLLLTIATHTRKVSMCTHACTKDQKPIR